MVLGRSKNKSDDGPSAFNGMENNNTGVDSVRSGGKKSMFGGRKKGNRLDDEDGARSHARSDALGARPVPPAITRVHASRFRRW